LFELRNEEINVEKILAVINATYPGKPDFFRLSFRNCVSCVNNCEDLLYIYLKYFGGKIGRNHNDNEKAQNNS